MIPKNYRIFYLASHSFNVEYDTKLVCRISIDKVENFRDHDLDLNVLCLCRDLLREIDGLYVNAVFEDDIPAKEVAAIKHFFTNFWLARRLYMRERPKYFGLICMLLQQIFEGKRIVKRDSQDLVLLVHEVYAEIMKQEFKNSIKTITLR